MLHTIEGYRRFVVRVMLRECAVTVAEDDTGIISFLSLREKKCGNCIRDLIASGAGPERSSSRRN
jgi:hypothetical protein